MNDMRVHWEAEGDIGILMLDSPPENFLTEPEFVSPDQIKQWLTEDIKGMVIAGSGRHFSAGADLESLLKQAANPQFLKDRLLKGNALMDFISTLNIPVVAAISGICFGGGLEIALACDLRICTSRSLFAFPEINHDLIPALGGLNRLQKLCGHKIAMEILFRGDTLNTHKAIELKIADKVTEGKESRQFAVDYLHSLVKGRPKWVIQKLMQSFRNWETMDLKEASERDADMFCELALAAAGSKPKGIQD